MSVLHCDPGTFVGLTPPPFGWQYQTDINAVPADVSQTLVGLRQQLEGLGLPSDALFRLELVLAEILNNIVEHAYGDTGRGVIEIGVSVHSGAIWCNLCDLGNPMPGGTLPLARRYALDDMDMQDLPEGGFGWGLIRDLTARLTYQRRGDRNLLDFRIDLES